MRTGSWRCVVLRATLCRRWWDQTISLRTVQCVDVQREDGVCVSVLVKRHLHKEKSSMKSRDRQHQSGGLLPQPIDYWSWRTQEAFTGPSDLLTSRLPHNHVLQRCCGYSCPPSCERHFTCCAGAAWFLSRTRSWAGLTDRPAQRQRVRWCHLAGVRRWRCVCEHTHEATDCFHVWLI